jgi:hypothetical protein
MKLTIEVEVPFVTVEDVQAFAYAENEYGMYVKVDPIDAVEVFIAMWMSSKLDYKVTKAEMIDDGEEVIDADGNAHWKAKE